MKRSKDDDRERDRRRPPSPEERVRSHKAPKHEDDYSSSRRHESSSRREESSSSRRRYEDESSSRYSSDRPRSSESRRPYESVDPYTSSRRAPYEVKEEYGSRSSYESRPPHDPRTSYESRPPPAYESRSSYESRPAYESRPSYESRSSYDSRPAYEPRSSYESRPPYEPRGGRGGGRGGFERGGPRGRGFPSRGASYGGTHIRLHNLVEGYPSQTAPPSDWMSSEAVQSGSGRALMNLPPIRGPPGCETDAEDGDSKRGARGRRVIDDIMTTKPEIIDSKMGTAGRVVTLQANYFKILKKPTWSLYQYRVEFSPETELPGMRKFLIREHKMILGGYLFDGSMLFTANRLQQDKTQLTSTTKSGDVVHITIKFICVISMLDGHAIQIFNLIMRRAFEGLKLQLVGRNFFDAQAKVDIPEHRMQLWPGYTTSIRQHEQDLLVCGEITHKVMRQETVYDILRNCSQQPDYQEPFSRLVIGTTVLTDYNNKTYRIDDIDFGTTPSKTFKTKDGEISFVDYYKKKYNITIRDVHQPMLMSRAKDKDVRAGQTNLMALVPELCRITGLTDEMRSNFQLMRAMAQHTQIVPDMRIKKLMAFNRRLQTTPESIDVIREWQMELDTKLVEFKARELPSEIIYFGNDKTVSTDQNADWTREFRGNNLYMLIHLNRWNVIVTQRNSREATAFIQILQQVGRGMGLNIADPRVMVIQDDRAQSYITTLEQCANTDPQLVMCLVPNNRTDRYSSIKKKCCVERGLLSQVMLAKTITPKGGNTRSLMSVATKVAIQINCKLGAAPWMVGIPIKGLMTIGYDVTHDTNDRSKSFGALVATMDLTKQAKYFSAVTQHQNGEELSDHLTLNVVKALHEYQLNHGCLPARILFYRDGVGEGQIHQVVDHEIKLLHAKLGSIYGQAGAEDGYKLAFIVVSKKINTRIFKNGTNPVPGTVVDDCITLPERYDFYLVSQTVRQGTVAPTSYNVIFDSMGFPPDKLQILTYKMCHLYYNWSGTTRVPAVCQYAHKLAFLVGQYIHQAPGNALEKQLYFL